LLAPRRIGPNETFGTSSMVPPAAAEALALATGALFVGSAEALSFGAEDAVVVGAALLALAGAVAVSAGLSQPETMERHTMAKRERIPE